jgi:hypothetical protein
LSRRRNIEGQGWSVAQNDARRGNPWAEIATAERKCPQQANTGNFKETIFRAWNRLENSLGISFIRKIFVVYNVFLPENRNRACGEQITQTPGQ